MSAYKIDAIPFQHPELDTWRENFKGVRFLYKPANFTVTGAVDDVWIKPEGELIVIDYKSTSKDGEVSIDAPWQIGYKRQMEVYQWLFRQNGHKVSNTGYFVYVNGKTDCKAFDGKLEFDVKIIPYIGDDSWIEKTIKAIRECLLDDRVPSPSPNCDYCAYRLAVSEVAIPTEKIKGEKEIKNTLFD